MEVPVFSGPRFGDLMLRLSWGGALTNTIGITLPMGIGGVILLREANKRLQSRFDLLTLIYWFTPLRFTGVPDSWKREFRG